MWLLSARGWGVRGGLYVTLNVQGSELGAVRILCAPLPLLPAQAWGRGDRMDAVPLFSPWCLGGAFPIHSAGLPVFRLPTPNSPHHLPH